MGCMIVIHTYVPKKIDMNENTNMCCVTLYLLVVDGSESMYKVVKIGSDTLQVEEKVGDAC